MVSRYVTQPVSSLIKQPARSKEEARHQPIWRLIAVTLLGLFLLISYFFLSLKIRHQLEDGTAPSLNFECSWPTPCPACYPDIRPLENILQRRPAALPSCSVILKANLFMMMLSGRFYHCNRDERGNFSDTQPL